MGDDQILEVGTGYEQIRQHEVQQPELEMKQLAEQDDEGNYTSMAKKIPCVTPCMLNIVV